MGGAVTGFLLANALARDLLEMHEHEGACPADCAVPRYAPLEEDPLQRATYAHAPTDPARAYWWRYASPTGWRVATGELCGPAEGYFRPDLCPFQLGFASHFLELRFGVRYETAWRGDSLLVTATDGEYEGKCRRSMDEVRAASAVVAEALYDFFVALRGEWAGRAAPFSRW